MRLNRRLSGRPPKTGSGYAVFVGPNASKLQAVLSWKALRYRKVSGSSCLLRSGQESFASWTNIVITSSLV